MKYAIVVNSKTGNTALLANEIQGFYEKDTCVYIGDVPNEELQVDILFVGFWTDKGSCHEDMAAYLKTLRNQQIFLFGTCGFGKDPSYFQKIIDHVSGLAKDHNEIIGSYMCQGKMPMTVRNRYESMLKENANMQRMIENFDQALTHPNQQDIEALKQVLLQLN